MTDKELRRLSRAELLEILIRLTNENEELKRNLNDAEGKLNDRKIMIGESDSIAEAALKLSDVFAAAESAAKLYLENSERLCDEKIADADAYAIQTKAAAEAEANEKIARSLTEALIDYTQAQRWNGQLPDTYVGASDALPVLNLPVSGGN